MDSHQKDNITLRRAKTQLAISINETDMSIDTLDVTASSLPDISCENNNEQVNILLEKIEEIQIQLNSAHAEIERLCLENRQLSINNRDLTKKNVLYKKLGNSPSKFTSSKLSTPKNTKANNTTKHKETQTEMLEPSQRLKKINLHKQCQTHIEPEKTDVQTQTLSLQTVPTNLPEQNHQHTTYQIPRITTTFKQNKLQNQDSNCKPKICILSTNKQNNVLTIAQDVLYKGSTICHYLSPKASIPHLLYGLQSKLKNFTMTDYCIIMLSNEDFTEGQSIQMVLDCIKKSLQIITHTNVLLYAPTYQYGFGKEKINQTIKTFNNLLYNDVQTYNYAYLVDSNSYLTYDYSMFHKPSGKVSNSGIRRIFLGLASIIEKIISNRQPSTPTMSNIAHKDDETGRQNQLFLE